MKDQIIPFRCEISDEVLTDLKRRLSNTRLPDQLDGAGWDYGTELSYLDELCTYWRDTFDWRAAEARFNRFPQFTTEINGETVHFYHIRSPEPDALPLIITHGYPGSVAEFLDLLGPLSDPASHGGDPRDAFHVIAPSIPGYGFSGPTRHKGFSLGKAAEVNVRLMERLGYDRYVAQGGDFGSAISSAMAAHYPDRVIALHLNFILGKPADMANPMAGLNEQELKEMEWKRNYDAHESGYQAIQGTKPQTLASGLTDSPAGLTKTSCSTGLPARSIRPCGSTMNPSARPAHRMPNGRLLPCPPLMPASRRKSARRRAFGPNRCSTSCAGPNCQRAAILPHSSSRNCSWQTCASSAATSADALPSSGMAALQTNQALATPVSRQAPGAAPCTSVGSSSGSPPAKLR